MVLDGLTDIVNRLLYQHGRDNFTERVVHTFTLWILIFFAFLLSSNFVFGQLLVCQAPAESPDSWVDYYHDYCYYQDKYRASGWKKQDKEIYSLNRGDNILLGPVDSNKSVITYYQWIPYIMAFKALLCLLPAFFWKHIGLRCFHGNDFDAVLRGFIQDMPAGKQVSLVRWMDDDAWKKIAADSHRLLKVKKIDRFGMHSTMLVYVIMKWLSFSCLLFQFWFTAKIYAGGSLLWGVHLTYDMINGAYEDISSGVFPRVVKCNLGRIQMSNVQAQNLHCLLTQNFINEKVFLFLYWWYLFACAVSFASAIRFTILLLSPRYQRYTTKSLLPTLEYFLEPNADGFPGTSDNDLLEYFIDYLGCDGYLLLQLISDMMHMLTVRQFSKELWRRIIVQNDADEDEEAEVEPSAPMDGQGDVRKFAGKGEEKKPLLDYEPCSSREASPKLGTDDAYLKSHQIDE